MPHRLNHADAFDLELDALQLEGAARDAVGRVLGRALLARPDPVAMSDVARGSMLARPTTMATTTVGRTISALVARDYLTAADPPTRLSPGRPVKPFTLSGSRALIGLHVIHREGRVHGLRALLTDLAGDVLPAPGADISYANDELPISELAEHAGVAVKKLIDHARGLSRTVMGVGIELGGHIFDDHVVAAPRAGIGDVDLAQDLSKLVGLPVVVENDINAYIIRETYRRDVRERDFAIIAVLDDGVGAGLAIDRRIYRGAGGSAGEVGHLAIEPIPASERTNNKERRGFSDPCSCGKWGHLETLACPSRMATELGVQDLYEITREPALDDEDRLTPTAKVFRAAGVALGRGAAAMANLHNPGRLIVLLPSTLALAEPGSAGALYMDAAETELNDAFSTSPNDARAQAVRLTVRPLDASELNIDGPRAAAMSVMSAFIDHARGHDACGAGPEPT